MSLAEDLREIRSRRTFSHDDLRAWVILVFQRLFGLTLRDMATEVVVVSETPGRADIILEGTVALEVKKDIVDEHAEALIQIERALSQFRTEGKVGTIAIGTDGIRWEFFILAGDKPYEFHEFELRWQDSDASLKKALLDGITAIREDQHRTKPTAEAIADVFKPPRPVFVEARKVLVEGAQSLLKRRPLEFTSKFRPWFDLFSFLYNNFEEGCKSMSAEARDLGPLAEALGAALPTPKPSQKNLTGIIEVFIRHTYLAEMAKLLGSLVAVGEEAVTRELLGDPRKVARGDLLRDNGVYIADPSDFFTWVAETTDVGTFLSALLKPLKRFSAEYSDDIFRHLYESIVDDDTRHELGEFFTPRWTAQLITREAVIRPEDRVLDPACGSGTFLVSALQRKAELARIVSTEKLSSFLQDVWGLDINPLSVLLARTNMYLAAATVLGRKRLPAELRFNVFVADTFLLPRFEEAEQRTLEADDSASWTTVQVTPEIMIPIHLKFPPSNTQKLVDTIGRALFERGRLDDVLSKHPAELHPYIRALAETMVKLKRTFGDNVWRFVLRNFSIPPLLRGSFDVVIGNPPWMTYREARHNLQDTIEAVGKRYEVLPPTQVKTSFNLAVAFFLTSTRFLKSGGRIGFVMPISLLEGASHVSFMENLASAKSGVRLLGMYDFAEMEPPLFPHTLGSCVLQCEVIHGHET